MLAAGEPNNFDVRTIVTLMAVASFVAVIVKRIKIPYTVALVIVGLGLGFFHAFAPIPLTEQLVLFTFLPALLFEAAWNLDVRHLRSSLSCISILAIFGVALSIFIIGALVNHFLGIPWLIALMFGAIVAPTDPVSVVAVMKQLHIDHKLASLVEGESLFNDGTSVVFFKLFLAIIMAFGMSLPAESIGTYITSGIIQFITVVAGGALLGGSIGLAFSVLTRYTNDHLLELTFTTMTAYGSFLLAESIQIPGDIPHLHLSGVIATVTAGLVMGNYGRQTGMSAAAKAIISSFWEYAAFFMNSLLFLLIGLEIQISQLAANWMPIGIGILGVILARIVSVYCFVGLGNATKIMRIPFNWQHLLVLAGLRGALSMALVLSIPRHILPTQTRELLILMVFGVVLFTLIVQGLSISKALKFLDLRQTISAELSRYQEVKAKLKSAKNALENLIGWHHSGEILETVAIRFEEQLNDELRTLNKELSEVQVSNDLLVLEDAIETKSQLLKLRKAAIADSILKGSLSEEAGNKLRAEYDAQLEELASGVDSTSSLLPQKLFEKPEPEMA